MEILNFCGIGGSGKTLDATNEAIKHYKKENNVIKKGIYVLFSKFKGKLGEKSREKLSYYNMFPDGRINNVYSSYPILLDIKRNIYSNKWSIFDFNNNYSFLPNSVFIDDEIQLKIDSDEYDDPKQKEEIKKIAKFMQSARHFGCNKIIITTQHPSRVFKKARNVTSRFVKHAKLISIGGIGFIKQISYYLLEDYGKYIPRKRKLRKMLSFDFKISYSFINFNRVYKSYDSRYLANYNYEKPLYNKGTYTSLKMDYNDLEPFFEGKKKKKQITENKISW